MVIDVAHVLVLEIYRDYGMKIEDAVNELQTRLSDNPDAPPRQAKKREPDNDAALVMLQAAMGGSDFRGPKG